MLDEIECCARPTKHWRCPSKLKASRSFESYYCRLQRCIVLGEAGLGSGMLCSTDRGACRKMEHRIRADAE